MWLKYTWSLICLVLLWSFFPLCKAIIYKHIPCISSKISCELLFINKGFCFFQVQGEIAERRQFLEEMESLGKGDQYRHIIETEISRVSWNEILKYIFFYNSFNIISYHSLCCPVIKMKIESAFFLMMIVTQI